MASSPRNRVLPSSFVALTIITVATCSWGPRWLFSGAPMLQFMILLGASEGYHILAGFGLWTIFATLNLVYAVASTSWLFHWIFIVTCYPVNALVCVYQFAFLSNFLKKTMRALLKELQLIDDKVAFFNIPALEIDTEVDGLMVMRGITVSLSSLSLVVHGVEVGIKLCDDMELAIQTEEVTVKLFRSIEISDCYCNLKGGGVEMTFGSLDISQSETERDPILISDTALLRAAAVASLEFQSQRKAKKMTEVFTDGAPPEDSSAVEAIASVSQMAPDNERAYGRYRDTLKELEASCAIRRCHDAAQKLAARHENQMDKHDHNSMLAATCANMHGEPSVPHPPSKSIKVTTLQSMTPLRVRRMMHRMPMLLRLLLMPLSYFHAIKIASITATGSGRWIETVLVDKIFRNYAAQDSEIRSLQGKICKWLCDAKFSVTFGTISGLAQVPFIPSYDINCSLSIDDVLAHRALLQEAHLTEVIRLGGADAAFRIPSFLLPHHEHLIPPLRSFEDKAMLKKGIAQANGTPKTIQAERELEQAQKDEANVGISVHASLPAVFDQELLDFIAALVKALKIVELEKESGAFEDEIHGFKEFGRALKGGMKDGMKKKAWDVVVNDRWIARMVGKIMKKMETAQGELGYRGEIPVKLADYRNEDEVRLEGEKLLP